jgi:hypothetical protein
MPLALRCEQIRERTFRCAQKLLPHLGFVAVRVAQQRFGFKWSIFAIAD